MLLQELKQIESTEFVKKLMDKLSSATNKYRELKTPAALKNLQKVEDEIERALGHK